MKSHRFFCHLIQELLNFGTPYHFSSAYFEMVNRVIKVGVHPYDTSSLPEHALTSMLARKDWAHQVSTMSQTSKIFWVWSRSSSYEK
uniref:Uncharacterized protein n=1 Tax=Panagrolaimus superbus TaxID=310955 RepID=A0A914Z470_9BILA